MGGASYKTSQIFEEHDLQDNDKLLHNSELRKQNKQTKKVVVKGKKKNACNKHFFMSHYVLYISTDGILLNILEMLSASLTLTNTLDK